MASIVQLVGTVQLNSTTRSGRPTKPVTIRIRVEGPSNGGSISNQQMANALALVAYINANRNTREVRQMVGDLQRGTFPRSNIDVLVHDRPFLRNKGWVVGSEWGVVGPTPQIRVDFSSLNPGNSRAYAAAPPLGSTWLSTDAAGSVPLAAAAAARARADEGLGVWAKRLSNGTVVYGTSPILTFDTPFTPFFTEIGDIIIVSHNFWGLQRNSVAYSNATQSEMLARMGQARRVTSPGEIHPSMRNSGLSIWSLSAPLADRDSPNWAALGFPGGGLSSSPILTSLRNSALSIGEIDRNGSSVYPINGVSDAEWREFIQKKNEIFNDKDGNISDAIRNVDLEFDLNESDAVEPSFELKDVPDGSARPRIPIAQIAQMFGSSLGQHLESDS